MSYNILRQLWRKGVDVSWFPTAGNSDLKAFNNIEKDFLNWLELSANNASKKISKEIPCFKLWHLNGSQSRIGTKLSAILKDIELDNYDQFRIINGNVLTGKTTNEDGFLGYYNNNISILREGNKFKLFGWIPFVNNNVPSIYRSSFSWLTSSKPKDYDTNLNGEERAFVVTGEMEKFFPMDIYPMQLIKECMTGNIEKMERLGIYEVAPEDFGLIDYASSSKIEAQSIVRDGLDYLIKETL